RGRHVVGDPGGARRYPVVHGSGPVVIVGGGPADALPAAFERDAVDLRKERVDRAGSARSRVDEEIVEVTAHGTTQRAHPFAEMRQPGRLADFVTGVVDRNRD